MDELGPLTQDGIFSRAVTLWQPARGYRFGVDSVLLGLFARPLAAHKRVVDLGAGVGVVGLALAFPDPAHAPPAALAAIELQPRLAALARRNFAENRPTAPCTLHECDLRALPPALRGSAELVLSNPPYFPAGEAKDPDPERARARSELTAPLPAVITAAKRLLRPEGVLALVYPAPRLPRLLGVLAQHPLHLRRLRLVHARRGGEGTLALLALRLGGGRNPPPLDVLPPLYLAEEDGSPAPDTEALLRRGH